MFQKPQEDVEIPEEIEALVVERTDARKAKDWARADAIRDELLEKGYVLEDKSDGTRVKKAR